MVHADDTRFLQVVELATGRVLSQSPLTWANHPGGAVLPSGDAVLIYEPSTGESFVLDVRTGEQTPSPVPPTEASEVVFSESGELVATADRSGDVVIRDGATFEVVHRLNAAEPISPFLAMAFSDDDRFLLTVHPTGGRLWDVASGQLIGQRIPTLEATAPSAIPGQATHLLTASEQWVQIWDLDVDRWGELRAEQRAETSRGRSGSRSDRGPGVSRHLSPVAGHVSPITVATSAGLVAGVAARDVVSVKGVPYGASTGGRSRFRQPQPIEPWAGVLDASSYADACPQPP